MSRLGDPNTKDEMIDEMRAHQEELKDENGVVCQICRLRDACFPFVMFEIMMKMDISIHSIKNFVVRDDDIFVLDYAKSGRMAAHY